MRIVSWNMNADFRSKTTRSKAWEYVREELGADLVLAQEAMPPPEGKAVFKPVGDGARSYKWGSAIVLFSTSLSIRPRVQIPLAQCYMTPATGDQLPDSHPGSCAVADVIDSAGRLIFTAISAYGQWEVMPDGRTMYACARVHRILSDLTSVLAMSHRRPVVLAGDLNITTQRAGAPSTDVEADAAAVVFARLHAWHLVDCITHTRSTRPRLPACTCGNDDGCSHVQTFRHKNSARSNPTQLDYAFVSESIVQRLKACRVVQDEEAWQLSDHCPIALDLVDN